MVARPKPRRARTKHYFKEWREYRELTRERAAERLDWSLSKMSRIESGTTPYSEDDLYAAAEVYQCTPSDLIDVNPLMEGEVIDLLELLHGASPNARRAALAMLKELKTGTDSQ